MWTFLKTEPRSHEDGDLTPALLRRFVAPALLGLAVALSDMSCTPTEPNELDKLGTARLSIAGQPFELWVADDSQERERGLMFVTAEQMAPLPDGTMRGMLFVFDHEQHLYFWMKNTIIPLDIAYLDSAGTIAATHTMAPFDDRAGRYPSGSPAQFAIEVKANVWADLGVAVGDRIEIPPDVHRD